MGARKRVGEAGGLAAEDQGVFRLEVGVEVGALGFFGEEVLPTSRQLGYRSAALSGLVLVWRGELRSAGMLDSVAAARLEVFAVDGYDGLKPVTT